MNNSTSFIRLFVGFILIATGVHGSCPIELSPPSVVVKYGDPVSINCSTSETVFESMGWESTQKGIKPHRTNHLKWAVKNLTAWDIYAICFINNTTMSTFNQCSRNAIIVLYTFPERISISSSSGSNGVMKENEEYKLTCHIHHVAPVQNLTVTWYKKDILIHEDHFNSSSNKPQNLSPVLNFTSTKEDNGVTFRCEAHMDLRPHGPQLNVASQEYNITVHYPPSQIFDFEDFEVEAGSSVELKCSSMGNPRPTYLWRYYRTANVIEENEDEMGRLLIHNATVYNAGSYTCQALNEKGNVSKTARVTVKEANRECPIEITPNMMVVQYQEKIQAVTCQPTPSSKTHLKEIYWQFNNVKVNSGSWHANTLEDWDIRPVCIASFMGFGTCHKQLDFTLFKTPDSVSIRSLHNSSTHVVGERLELQCDIVRVAPAQNVVVRWYQGNDTFTPTTQDLMQVNGCPDPSENCNISTSRFPLTLSSTINITLNRKHNGVEFRCAAQMNLGPDSPPEMMSSPLNITVHYKPVINETKLPKKILVFDGYLEELVCEADGHPAPKIQWDYSEDKMPHVSGDTLIVSKAGFYNCTATNEVDSVFHEVEVILKEDYLPLIAGFVAVTVIAISTVFVFIYSIYYKNTKIRRYSLKNPKLSTHNGNVAHNGWDLQFPMTKLS